MDIADIIALAEDERVEPRTSLRLTERQEYGTSFGDRAKAKSLEDVLALSETPPPKKREPSLAEHAFNLLPGVSLFKRRAYVSDEAKERALEAGLLLPDLLGQAVGLGIRAAERNRPELLTALGMPHEGMLEALRPEPEQPFKEGLIELSQRQFRQAFGGTASPRPTVTPEGLKILPRGPEVTPDTSGDLPGFVGGAFGLAADPTNILFELPALRGLKGMREARKLTEGLSAARKTAIGSLERARELSGATKAWEDILSAAPTPPVSRVRSAIASTSERPASFGPSRPGTRLAPYAEAPATVGERTAAESLFGYGREAPARDVGGAMLRPGTGRTSTLRDVDRLMDLAEAEEQHGAVGRMFERKRGRIEGAADIAREADVAAATEVKGAVRDAMVGVLASVKEGVDWETAIRNAKAEFEEMSENARRMAEAKLDRIITAYQEAESLNLAAAAEQSGRQAVEQPTWDQVLGGSGRAAQRSVDEAERSVEMARVRSQLDASMSAEQRQARVAQQVAAADKEMAQVRESLDAAVTAEAQATDAAAKKQAAELTKKAQQRMRRAERRRQLLAEQEASVPHAQRAVAPSTIRAKSTAELFARDMIAADVNGGMSVEQAAQKALAAVPNDAPAGVEDALREFSERGRTGESVAFMEQPRPEPFTGEEELLEGSRPASRPNLTKQEKAQAQADALVAMGLPARADPSDMMMLGSVESDVFDAARKAYQRKTGEDLPQYILNQRWDKAERVRVPPERVAFMATGTAVPAPTPTHPVFGTGPVKGAAQIRREAQAAVGRPIRKAIPKVDLPESTAVKAGYKTRSEVIITKLRNDLQGTAHEMGHLIEQRLYGAQPGRSGPATFAKHDQFLASIATQAKSKAPEAVRSEGFSEAVRKYINAPEELTNTPEGRAFLADFAREMEAKEPEMWRALGQMQDDVQALRKATPQERIRADIVRSAPADPTNLNTAERAVQQAIDDHYALEKMQRQIADTLSPAEDLALHARAYRNLPAMVEHMMEIGPLDAKTGRAIPGIPGLSQIYASSGDVATFRDYAIAKRDLLLDATRNVQINPESNRKMADAKALVAAVEASRPEIVKANELRVKFNRAVLDYYRDMGMIEARDYQRILATEGEAIPFHRLLGSKAAEAPIMRKVAVEGGVADPLITEPKNAVELMRAAEKNRLGQLAWGLAQRQGAGKWLEVLDASKVKIKQKHLRLLKGLKAATPGTPEYRAVAADMARQLSMGNDGARYLETLDKATLRSLLKTFTKPVGTAVPGRVNVLVKNFNGAVKGMPEQVMLSIDKDAWSAIESLTPKQIEAARGFFERWAGKILAGSATLFRKGTTEHVFFGVKGLIRDIRSSGLLSRAQAGWIPGEGIKSAISGMASLIRKDEWARMGTADRALSSDFVSIARAGGDPERAFRQLEQQGVLRKALDKLSKYLGPQAAQKLGNAVRLGEYKAMIKKALIERALAEGKTMKEARRLAADPNRASREMRLLAADAGREVGVDFARHGAATQYLRSVSPFWNPSTQGWRSEVLTMWRHPVRGSAALLSGAIVPAAIAWWTSHDDPRYKALAKETRWANDTISLGPGIPLVSFPRPPGLMNKVGAMMEALLNRAHDEDPGVAEDVAEMWINEAASLTPFISNPAAKAGYEILSGNKAEGTWRKPVVPPFMSRLTAGYQKYDDTSLAAKGPAALFEALGMPRAAQWVNPIQTERTIRTLLGSLPAEGLKLGGHAVEGLFGTPAPRPERGVLQTIPGLRSFFARENVSWPRFVEQLDEKIRPLEAVKATLKTLEGSPEYQDYREGHLTELRELARLEGTDKSVREMLGNARAIAQAKGIKSDEKKRRMAQLAYQANDIARKALAVDVPRQ